jgi:hypothetical protein
VPVIYDGSKELYRVHPLNEFAINSQVRDSNYADIILYFVNDLGSKERERHDTALWFLFDSEAFYRVCAEAGIYADGLRNHLLHLRRKSDSTLQGTCR